MLSLKPEQYVTEGTAGKEIFVFSDPQCGYCKKFGKMAEPYIEKGMVKLNWVKVGIMGANSRTMAADI